MAYFKRFFGKLFGLLIVNGALYAVFKIIVYIVGVLYWQGLLNTLSIDYSFVKMDDYNFYVVGGFLTYKSSYVIVLSTCLIMYFIICFLFLFSDGVYWILEKIRPKMNDKKFKFQTTLFFIFLILLLICVIALLTIKATVGSYQKGQNEALAIIKDQRSATSDNKEKDAVSVKKTIQLKSGKVLSGTLIGCSQDQCIIYSNNKAFTVEKAKIESLISEFDTGS